MTPEAAQDLQAYFGMEIFGDNEDEDDSDQDFESKNENTMKLTESKLRSIIREELLKESRLSRQYQNVADEALENASEDPKAGLKHVMSMINLSESITLQLEQSNLDTREVQKLLKALQSAGVEAEMLFNRT
jgi:hypothetical protein